MKEVIEKAKELVEKERPGDIRVLLDIANKEGQVLAKKLNADKDVVMLGCLFMDIKRKQAVQENRLKDHTKMAIELAKDLFSQFDLDEETKNKVYNCIDAHHGDVPYTCLEAEIVANADCYKFLHPKGMLQYIKILSRRDDNFETVLKEAEAKLEEKHKILSLEICKKELEPYYQMFKKIFEKAKESA